MKKLNRIFVNHIKLKIIFANPNQGNITILMFLTIKIYKNYFCFTGLIKAGSGPDVAHGHTLPTLDREMMMDR